MTVRVSDLRLYLLCPRQVYFTSCGHKLNEAIAPGHIEHLLLKELALQFPSLIGEILEKPHIKGMVSTLTTLLDDAGDRVRVIYRNELKGITEKQLLTSKSKIDIELIAMGLEKSTVELGGGLTQQITPWKVQHQVYSKRLDMIGCPDKIVQINGELFPSIIKTGNKPEYGVWKNDKLQLTAYAILIEEEFDAMVGRGLVEYCRYGDFREVHIRHTDRRKVLQILDKVQKIKGGALPDRTEKTQCSSCEFIELCRTESSLLSKFF